MKTSTIPNLVVRCYTHSIKRPVSGSTDYIVRSFFNDGTMIDRRYTHEGFLLDVPLVKVMSSGR